MSRKIIPPLIIAGLVTTFILTALWFWNAKRPSDSGEQVNVENIMNDIRYLSSDAEFQPLQYRVAGMEGEKKAAKYIENSLKSSGWRVSQQGFSFSEIVHENRNSVEISLADGTTIHPTTSEIHAAQNVDEVRSGKLIDLGKGTVQDFQENASQIKGNFILFQIDETTSVDYFSLIEFSQLVKGMIIYQPGFEAPNDPVIANKFVLPKSTLYEEKVMTITTISEKDYMQLSWALSENPDLTISEAIQYDVEKEDRSSQNIVASRESANPENPLVLIGAHYDSVNTPGADDNASGVAAMLELGRLIGQKEMNYDVRMVAFGAEEIGLFGSNSYLSSLSENEIKRCQLMINLDGPGVGNVFVIGKSTGENAGMARKIAIESAESHHIDYKLLEFPDSDQFFFNQVGIPTLTLASLKSAARSSMLFMPDTEEHNFMDLAKENVLVPSENHTLDDTVEMIEESNKAHSNFQKLFTVLFDLLNSPQVIHSAR